MGRRLAQIVLVACAVATAAAPGAPAAAPPDPSALSGPREFFRVMVDGPMIEPGFDFHGEAALIRRTGLRSARVAFNWYEIQPSREVTYWRVYDERVAGLAYNGIRVMPTIIRAPAWAAGWRGG